jgi:hypothetical protein
MTKVIELAKYIELIEKLNFSEIIFFENLILVQIEC